MFCEAFARNLHICLSVFLEEACACVLHINDEGMNGVLKKEGKDGIRKDG